MSAPSAAQRRRRRDALTLGAALALLLLGALAWWLWTDRAQERRAEMLAGLPRFPSRGPGGPPPAETRPPPPRPPPPPARVRDPLAAFALAPAANLVVIQVNALLNTPLYARLRRCLPPGLEEGLADAGALGLDLGKDVDRVALIPGGMALSGDFGGRPLAERVSRGWRDTTVSQHRGAEVRDSPKEGCVAQAGTLLLMGAPGTCQGLVDRALDSPPPDGGAEALESDVYGRTDLQALRAGGAAGPAGQGELVQPVVDSLGQVTLRANVWDQVALSIDGTPVEGGAGRLEALASLARLSVSAGRAQASDDPAWSALLEQARVEVRGGHLLLDLAIPGDALFDRLQLPCPGRDGGTW